MVDAQIREELKRIIAEFKKPLPANQHKVRDLPGTSNRWIYLPHQAIRERLDEVAPDWTIDYSELQYIDNNCVCRCGITILGVRKEAIACVPISLLSSNNKEMTRGSAADRVAAESVRNASEQWGVGRYLDDQVYVYRYLWEHRHELDDEMSGQLQKLKQQHSKALSSPKSAGKSTLPASFAQPRAKEEGSVLHSMTDTSPVLVITESQRKRLWAVGRNEYKLSSEQIKSAYKHFGFEKPEQIAANKYDDVMSYMKTLSVQTTSSPSAAVFSNPNNNAVIKTLLTVLAIDQGKFDNWFAQYFPGATADLLSQADMERILRSLCKSHAQQHKNQVAEQVIDNVVIGQYRLGVAINDALNDWKSRYFQTTGVR